MKDSRKCDMSHWIFPTHFAEPPWNIFAQGQPLNWAVSQWFTWPWRDEREGREGGYTSVTCVPKAPPQSPPITCCLVWTMCGVGRRRGGGAWAHVGVGGCKTSHCQFTVSPSHNVSKRILTLPSGSSLSPSSYRPISLIFSLQTLLSLYETPF